MGIFGGLGNILGKVTGIRVQPFKGKVGLKTPLQGLNTGDFMTLASLFAPGGNLFNVKGLGSLGTSNLLKNLSGTSLQSLMKNPALLNSLFQANGKSGGGGGAMPPVDLNAMSAIGQYSDLLKSLLPGAQQEAKDLAGVSAQRSALAKAAASRLTPGMQQAGLDRQRSILIDQAKRGIRSQELALGPAATGLKSGLALRAMNQANSQANQFERDAYSPEAMAMMDQQRLALMDPRNFTTTLDASMNGLSALTGMLNQQRLADAQYRQSKPPTFLESILPLLGQIGGGFDWSKLFK